MMQADVGRFQKEPPAEAEEPMDEFSADERYEYAAERRNWPGNEDIWLESRMEQLRRLR